MTYQVDPITTVDEPVLALLRRALAPFSEDMADDLARIRDGLESGERSGALLRRGGTPCGVVVWRYEDAPARRYAAVTLLHADEPDRNAAAALVQHTWDTLTAAPELEMIAVRVREDGAASSERDSLRDVLLARDTVIFERQLMTCSLPLWDAPEVTLPDGYSLALWTDDHQPAVEAVALAAQPGGVDEIVVPDAQGDRLVEALRKIRAGTYPNIGPLIPAASFVALDEAGAVAGYLAAVDMGMMGFVVDVAVHPDHRRRGLARALMVRSMVAVKAQSFPLMGLAVTRRNPAARLYESLGFTVRQRGQTAIWWRDGRHLRWRDSCV